MPGRFLPARLIPGDCIAGVEDGRVRLSIPAMQARRQWQGEAMNPAMNPTMTGATQGQRTMLGAAEGGRGGGRRQSGEHRQGEKPRMGGADDVTGGTGPTKDPI